MVLTQEFVRDRFYLETETWTLYYRKRHNERGPDRTGTKAGCIKHGYIAIDISATRFYAHQIIWLYVHGEWLDYIEHKDGNGLNNDPTNLRPASHEQNMANKERKFHGVEKHGRKFRARLDKDGLRHELGSFHSREEAEAAYIKKHLELFGEYSVYNRN